MNDFFIMLKLCEFASARSFQQLKQCPTGGAKDVNAHRCRAKRIQDTVLDG